MNALLKKFRYGPAHYAASVIERRSERLIKSNSKLRDYLAFYGRSSPSTGCSYTDYLLLYRYIKNYKPKEVLECGTGFSTVVLAQALKENEEEHGIRGRLVSMEQHEHYYQAALESLHPELKNDPRYEIVLSPAVEETFEIFRGLRYQDLPKRNYDFVYIDGPDLKINPVDNHLVFNSDFARLVAESNHPIGAMIDTRQTSCFVYSLLFPGKFQYDYLRRVGIVEPVTRNDLADTKKIVARVMAKHGFRRPPLGTIIGGSY